MNEEEKIKNELEEKFVYLKDVVIIKRKGRIFTDVSLEKFEEVFAYAVKQMNFAAISAITGMDNVDSFKVMYHLHREGRIVLTLRVSIARDNPEVKSVTPFFPGADICEREIIDLLGIQVSGLAQGNRYPLPDNWPKGQYPLRKDWVAGAAKKEVPNA